MKYITGIFLLTLLIILSSCSEDKRLPGEALVIKGTLLGHDNKPMVNADISLIVWKNKEHKESKITADDNGNFKFSTELEGDVKMTFSGVNHIAEDIRFNIDNETDNLDISVSLQALKVNNEPESVKIIGSFNNYDFASAMPMEDKGNGIYSITIPKETDTLYYQIIGHLNQTQQRSTNGTMQDFYVYDGGGDYRSAIVNNDSEVTIEFDLNKMNFENKLFVFESNNQSISDMVLGFAEVQRLMGELLTEVRSHYPPNSEMKKKLIGKAIKRKFEALKDLTKIYKSDEITLKINSAYLSNLSRFAIVEAKDYVDLNYVKQLLNESKTNDKMFKENLSSIFYAIEATGGNPLESELINSRINSDDKKANASIYNEIIAYAYKSKDSVRLIKYYNEFFEKFPDSKLGKRIKINYNPHRVIEVGKTVPEFSSLDLNDLSKKFDNSQLAGKFVLIDVWATWCGPCLREMPYLQKAYDKFKNKNFTILSISIDAKAETVHNFRKNKWELPWYNSIGEEAWKSSIVETFQISGIPMGFLIDPNGKIVATGHSLRSEGLMKTLESIL